MVTHKNTYEFDILNINENSNGDWYEIDFDNNYLTIKSGYQLKLQMRVPNSSTETLWAPGHWYYKVYNMNLNKQVGVWEVTNHNELGVVMEVS